MECWGVSAYDGHKQTDVCFCQLVADEVILARENRLETVERVEELVDRVFVGLLGPREPTLVHAICLPGEDISVSSDDRIVNEGTHCSRCRRPIH